MRSQNIGDIITANSKEKRRLVAGAADWYGSFLILRVLFRIFNNAITNWQLRSYLNGTEKPPKVKHCINTYEWLP